MKHQSLLSQSQPPHLCDSTLCHGLAEAYIYIHRSSRSSAELVLLQELTLVGRLRGHVAIMATHHALSLWHPRRRHILYLEKSETHELV